MQRNANGGFVPPILEVCQPAFQIGALTEAIGAGASSVDNSVFDEQSVSKEVLNEKGDAGELSCTDVPPAGLSFKKRACSFDLSILAWRACSGGCLLGDQFVATLADPTRVQPCARPFATSASVIAEGLSAGTSAAPL